MEVFCATMIKLEQSISNATVAMDNLADSIEKIHMNENINQATVAVEIFTQEVSKLQVDQKMIEAASATEKFMKVFGKTKIYGFMDKAAIATRGFTRSTKKIVIDPIMKRATKATNQFTQAIRNTKAYNIMKRTTDATKGFVRTLSNARVKAESIDIIKGKVKDLYNNFKVGAKLKDAFMTGLNMSGDLQKTQEIFSGILGDADKGKGLFNHISKAAKKSSLSFNEMAANTRNFLGIAETTTQLDKMNNMAERLAKLNNNDISSQDASKSMTEMFKGGDVQSFAEQFNISDDMMKTSGLEASVSTGDMDKSLSILDELMNKTGYSQEALNGVTANVGTQWKMLSSNIALDFGTAMKTVQETLTPVFEKLNSLVDSGVLQPFIDGLVGGFNLVAMGIGKVVDAFIWLFDFISSNWEVVSSILMAIGLYFISILWSMIVPIIAQAAAWFVSVLPILLIIAAIAGVLFILKKLGIGAEEICGFIGGSFNALFAIIQNLGIWFKNGILSIAEFFINKWNEVTTGIKNMFIDLQVSAIEKLKGIAEFMDKIFGTNISASLEAKTESLIASKAEAEKVHFDRQEYKDISASFDSGVDVGSAFAGNVGEGIGDFINKITPDKEFGVGFNLDEIVKDGAMPVTSEKTLDVSMNKDDIRYLKDLAEREFIAKYSNSTLAPNVSIQFGDVRETADANKVANVIEKILREEIAVVAEGV